MSSIVAVAAFALLGSDASACGDYRVCQVLDEARKIVDDDPDAASAAIAALRAKDSAGLTAALIVHRKVLGETDAAGKPTPAALRARRALDEVAGQRDAHAARLFWYTDLEAARAAAARSLRPILSLRLLGRLDEDLSCANSRFFRTALYANRELTDFLRANFVLHWKTVRPVPVLTIDFGDGRKVCRTITGNSIHYVLDAEGRVIDGLPGLLHPKAFRAALDRAAGCERSLRGLEPGTRALALARWHAAMGKRLDDAFARDLAAVGAAGAPAVVAGDEGQGHPTATRAAVVAVGKMAAEMPAVRALQPEQPDPRKEADTETWSRIAALHAAESRLDESSRALMRAKSAAAAMPLAPSKRLVEDPLLATIRNFERSMAEDTVRNEYDLHRTLHGWLAAAPAGDVDVLNERVYADLFLTPSDDPWLGLVPADTYVALDGEGLAVR